MSLFNFINTGLYFVDKDLIDLIKIKPDSNEVLQWRYDIHDFLMFLSLLEDT